MNRTVSRSAACRAAYFAWASSIGLFAAQVADGQSAPDERPVANSASYEDYYAKIGREPTESPLDESHLDDDGDSDAPVCCHKSPCCCEKQSTPPPPDYGGCLWHRNNLTGDWFGARGGLAESGITLDAALSQFYQGVADGGVQRHFKYGGHGDYVVTMDMDKLAGRQGLFMKLRAEHRFGETINRDTGAILPAAIQPELPAATEDLALTNVLFTQFLSESFGIFVGKLDTLDGDANAFAHGRGKEQFLNMAFVANPIAIQSAGYSVLGTGFVILRDLQPIFTFSVINPVESATTSGFEHLGSEGVTLVPELRLPTNFFGMPGHQLLGATWSSREYTALGQDPRILFPVLNVPIERKSGTWSMYWNCDQYLAVDSDSPLRGWGYFGRAGISDGNPNALEWFLSFGIGGDSPLAGRPNDRFGIGWYHAAASDELGPIANALLDLGDGQGVEIFYNAQVTPWFRLTPDIQIINPGRQNFDTAFVVGFRGVMEF